MKKIICLLVILVNIISVVITASAVQLSETSKNELYSYGIMIGDEVGALRLNDNITRAEFSKMICVALGFGDPEGIQLSVIEDFYDVNINHWAYNYIQLSKGMGLVEGVGNGYFKPDENIKVQDAVKIIVTALGYKSKADSEPYPMGYINIAQEIGLINKSDFNLESYAVREEIAYLVYGSLDIPLMYQTSFGKESEYTIMDGTNNVPLITLRKSMSKENIELEKTNENEVPRFNGAEYTGRLVKISNLKKTGDNYYFNNSLNKNDTSTYVITKDTYVYLSENTLDLSEIKNDMYMQCWHYTDDKDNIKLLKVELMKDKPSGV